VVRAPAQSDVVVFGSTVTVADDESGREATWTLVGPTEANVSEGKLSAESPMAKALMGRRPGDQVEVQTPRGVRRQRVVRLG
jgi:transcription elongation factor GreA